MDNSLKWTFGCSNKGVAVINPPQPTYILYLILISSECLNVATSAVEAICASITGARRKAHKCYASGNLQSVPSLTKLAGNSGNCTTTRWIWSGSLQHLCAHTETNWNCQKTSQNSLRPPETVEKTIQNSLRPAQTVQKTPQNSLRPLQALAKTVQNSLRPL